MGEMGAGHFIYIPATIVFGIVIGWILGSRAARDAFAAELRSREESAARAAAKAAPRYRPRPSRVASASGMPASRMRACARSTG